MFFVVFVFQESGVHAKTMVNASSDDPNFDGKSGPPQVAESEDVSRVHTCTHQALDDQLIYFLEYPCRKYT